MSDKTGRVGVYPRTGSNSFWNQYKETLLGKNGKKPYSESSISQIDYETKKIITYLVKI